jgi:signal peptide peptidase SppA
MSEATPKLLRVKYPHILRTVLGSTWAILPEKLTAIVDFLQLKAAGGEVPEEEIQALTAARRSGPAASPGAIAVLPLFGTITHRVSSFDQMSGLTSTERFSARLAQAVNDPGISSIVIDVDSPGGMVNGVDELSEQIAAARSRKRIVAVANSLMASAAYWIASAASEVVAIPSAEVGSIGVIGLHTDMSKRDEMLGVKHTLVTAGKFKGEMNPFEPLSDEAREHLQQSVDEFYGMFVKRVAKNRSVKASDVRNGFGEGRVVGAKEALAEGMIDRIETMEQTLRRAASAKMAEDWLTTIRGLRDSSGTSNATEPVHLVGEKGPDLAVPEPPGPEAWELEHQMARDRLKLRQGFDGKQQDLPA